jgi:hypothetical protein
MKFEDRLRSIVAPEEAPHKPKSPDPPPADDDFFAGYKAEFYRLRWLFFKRAPEPDGECLSPETCGAPLCANCRAWAEWEIRGACYRQLAETPDNDTGLPRLMTEKRTFTAQINTALPLEQQAEEVARQAKEIFLRERTTAHGGLLHGLLKAKDGKNRPTGGRRDTFEHWELCLAAYDYRERDGLSWRAVGAILTKKPYAPKGTLTRIARDLYHEAQRLIQSAASGTFPD